MQLIKFYTGRDRQDGEREDFPARHIFEEYLIDKFGGFTRTDTLGGWKNNGEVYRRREFTYETLTFGPNQHVDRDTLRGVAHRMLLVFDQRAILYTIQKTSTGGFEYGSVAA